MELSDNSNNRLV